MARNNSYGTKVLEHEDRSIAVNPVYILASSSSSKSNYNTKMCYCSECKKVSDIGNISLRRYHEADGVINNGGPLENGCPQCGNSSSFVLVHPTKTQEEGAPVSTVDAWRIPMNLQGRYVFAFRRPDGTVSRVEDNIMFDEAYVFPSGEVFSFQSEYSSVADFMNRESYVAKARIDGNGRKLVMRQDDVDYFRYQKIEAHDSASAYSINHL